MLYILFYLLLLFFIINYAFVRGDYFHPTIIFNFTFLIATLFCILNAQEYAIEFNGGTVFIVTISMLVFTIITVLSKKIFKTNTFTFKNKLKYLYVSKSLIFTIIIIQILNLIFFYRYEQALFSAYVGGRGSFSQIINNYDQLVKFFTEDLVKLGVRSPFFYRVFNSFISPISYVIIYIICHNYVATRRIDKFQLLVPCLFAIQIFMTGSRGSLFKILTFILVVFYILLLRNKGLSKLSSRFAFKVLIVVVAVAPLFVLYLNATGRSGGVGQDGIIEALNRELFKYIGAPLLNFNNFIAGHDPYRSDSVYWGEQTFYGFYKFLYSKLHLIDFNIKSIIGSDSFVKSTNGLPTGNVFTTFYTFFYDFTYFGIIPLVSVIALYFVPTYSRILGTEYCAKKYLFDYKLFIYAYLFNDVIMLIFSNRFFESILTVGFLRFLITSAILVWIIKQNIVFKYKK